MEKLKNYIHHLNSIEDLASIVQKANADISFLGSRIIKVEGYSGSANINFAAKKAMKLFEPLMKKWDYSLKERKNIRVIEVGIDKAYFDSDTLLETANIITKFFNWLKEIFHMVYSTRRKWRNQPALSDCYSAEQYKKAFPTSPFRDSHDEEYQNNILYHSPPPYEIHNTWLDKLFNLLLNE